MYSTVEVIARRSGAWGAGAIIVLTDPSSSYGLPRRFENA